jgi:hypothetical protein
MGAGCHLVIVDTLYLYSLDKLALLTLKKPTYGTFLPVSDPKVILIAILELNKTCTNLVKLKNSAFKLIYYDFYSLKFTVLI